MEDREIECQAELDGVAWGESDLVSFIVCLECSLLDFFKLCIFGILGNVTVVVANHLHEESFSLTFACFAKHLRIDHVDNLLAICGKLVFDLLLVHGKSLGELGVLRILLDGGNGTAGGTL